jgi:molybdopterin/thiamine biosynthesis adenylyltransferase
MIPSSPYYTSLTDRHQGILTRAQQETLADSLICVAGTGGVGGNAAVALARLGCCRFRLADNGTFEPSNANRQAGCGAHTLGRNKAEVIGEELRAINPEVQVEVHPEGITRENASAFVAQAAVVLDGIDLGSLPEKKLVYDESRRQGITLISSPIVGFGTALAIFDPVRSPAFDDYFGPIPDLKDPAVRRAYVRVIGLSFFNFLPRLDWPTYMKRVNEGNVPSVGAACLLSASLTTAAVVDLLLGSRTFPVVPTTIHVDVMSCRIRKMGRVGRFFLRILAGLRLKR